jgi:hypothetical protein
MRKEDIEIGMKVVPFQKTLEGYAEFEDSHVWKRAKEKNQNYLYVIDFDEDETYYILSEIMNDEADGDFFNAEDFEPYEKGTNKYSLKDICCRLIAILEKSKPMRKPEQPDLHVNYLADEIDEILKEAKEALNNK